MPRRYRNLQAIHTGSHSVICHAAEMTRPPLPQRNNAVPTRGNPYKVLLKVSQTNVRRLGANCFYME